MFASGSYGDLICSSIPYSHNKRIYFTPEPLCLSLSLIYFLIIQMIGSHYIVTESWKWGYCLKYCNDSSTKKYLDHTQTLGIRKGCTQYTRLSLLWDLSISTIILGVGIFLYIKELPDLFPFQLHVNWLNQQKKEYLSFNQLLFIISLHLYSNFRSSYTLFKLLPINWPSFRLLSWLKLARRTVNIEEL